VLTSVIARMWPCGSFRYACVLILCIGVVFLTMGFAAHQMGLHKSEPSNRLRFHALPVAISQLYHGMKHDYTAWNSIAMPFQADGPITDRISTAVLSKPPANDGVYFWTADDRGLADYVYVAFVLFGPGLFSLFLMWFLVLGAQLAVTVLRFLRDPPGLVVICCTLIAIAAVIPLYTRASGTTFGESSIHISESRLFDVLGALAAVHLILSIFRPFTAARWLYFAGIGASTFILFALVHARMSVAWLVLPITIISCFHACRMWRRKRDVARFALVPAMALVIGFAALLIYQHKAFNPAYRSGIGPRTMWHNILMGTHFNGAFAEKLGMVHVSDQLAAAAVIAYMKKTNDPRLTPDWNVDYIMNSLGSHNTFDWRTYESVARSLVLRTFIENPVETLRLFLIDKPATALSIVSCNVIGMGKCGWESRVPVVLSFILGVIFLSVAFVATRIVVPGDIVPVLLSCILMTITATGPSILFYPAVTQLGGAIVFLLLTIQLALILLAMRLAGRTPKHRQPAIVQA
jgi:hypothetical protein